MRVGVFLDVSNLYHGAKATHNKKINYRAFYKFIQDHLGPISVAKAYGVQTKNEAEAFIASLSKVGFEPIYKKTRSYSGVTTGDIDTHLTVDIVRHLDDFDFLLLGSADADFLPIVDYALEQNKRVMIMACNVSHLLQERADICAEIHEGLLL